MLRMRTLGAAIALVATGAMALSSVAAAQAGPQFGPWEFDNRWVGTDEADEYTAPDQSRDLIIGLGGDDVLRAGDGSDKIVGGLGDDRLHGGLHADKIVGGPGADGINGGLGNDLIKAGKGNDRVVANDGMRDHISCGAGFDAVKADRRDRVARDCERVVRVRPDRPEDATDD